MRAEIVLHRWNRPVSRPLAAERWRARVPASTERGECPSVGRILEAAATGTAAGTIGTMAMSALMLAANWLGILGTMPPRRISDRLVDAVGTGWRTPERHRRVGTVLVHFGIGAGAGAGLGVARELQAVPRLTPLLGSALGSVFWVINYIGIAPALGILPPPHRDRPGRPLVMLAANALFGTVTAGVIEAMRRENPGHRRGNKMSPTKP